MVDLLGLVLLVAHLLLHLAQVDVLLHVLQPCSVQLVLFSLLAGRRKRAPHVIFVEGRELPKTVAHEVHNFSGCGLQEDIYSIVEVIAMLARLYPFAG